MAQKILKRNFFLRLLGRCATAEPSDPECWAYANQRITIDLKRAAELGKPGGAIRLESDALPQRVLVIHGDDSRYHAFHNKCTHGGRRLDPVPGAETVQCCSVGKSTFAYDGKLLEGSAKEPVNVYPVQVEGDKINITIQ